jgi:hypothetical protein
MVCVGGGYWSANERPGYPGYDGKGAQEYRADSDAVVDAMLRWASAKPSGNLNVLLMTTAPPTSPGYAYSSQFQAGLARLGHSYTITGALGNFGAYEPLDFDVTCAPDIMDTSAYHGLTTSAAKIDYILTHQGALLVDSTGAFGTPGPMARYGIVTSAGWHSSHGAGVYQRNFGAAPEYKLVFFTTRYLTLGTNTQGVIGSWDGPLS